MKVSLFGGTGFVGSYIIQELIKRDFITQVLVRKGSESKIISNVEIFIGDINNNNDIIETMKSSEVVIYTIGIIREYLTKGITYERLHLQGVKNCIEVASKLGINRFILMSANGVKPDGTDYQKTKWQAEELLKTSDLNWTIFRPSLIFGNPKGNGRTEFCIQLRDDMLSLPFPAPLFYTGLFPIHAGSFCMSPIHVKNVAEFFVKAIQKSESIGKTYTLGGIKSHTWKEIIHEIAIASRKRTWKIPVPVFGIKIAAALLDRFEWFPITEDQLTMLMEGNSVKQHYFSDYGIESIPFTRDNLNYLKDN
jgi:NADH dehydrogenase